MSSISSKTELVKKAMLSVQRYPWEQGVCMQAIYESGDLTNADRVADTMEQYVDSYELIHEVCGCPDFLEPGTSAESIAAYLMMHAWKNKWI